MTLSKIRLVTNKTKSKTGDTALELAKRFGVTTLKSNPSIVTSVFENLEDLNGKSLPVGYTDECCYILLTTSDGNALDGIADNNSFGLIHDTTVGEDGVDMRFINQFDSFLPIVYFNEFGELIITDAFDCVMDRKRFGGLVKNALDRVKTVLSGASDWRIDAEPMGCDYGEYC